MERVEGVDYLEPGKTYRLPIYSHHSIVYPGEIVPLMLNDSTLYSGRSNDSSDGLKFGLVFQNQYRDGGRVYGVTCQVYERGAEGLSALMKTVAQQRFYIVRQSQERRYVCVTGRYVIVSSVHWLIEGLSFCFSLRRADVKILPEIVLPDPLISTCSNAMVRYAHSSRKDRLSTFKRLLTQTTVWPQFVYDQYDTKEVMAKVERFLSSLNITSVQTDKVKLSFWLARNIPLTEEYRKMIFCTDSVLRRMLIINKALDHVSVGRIITPRKNCPTMIILSLLLLHRCGISSASDAKVKSPTMMICSPCQSRASRRATVIRPATYTTRSPYTRRRKTPPCPSNGHPRTLAGFRATRGKLL